MLFYALDAVYFAYLSYNFAGGSKSSPGDFRHRLRDRFFIDGFTLPAALEIP
jgi:hypothetical protein